MTTATPGATTDDRPLAVLVIDDERPALDELTWLLRRDARVVTLSLSWRLGNDQPNGTNRRRGAEDEMRRAQ